MEVATFVVAKEGSRYVFAFDLATRVKKYEQILYTASATLTKLQIENQYASQLIGLFKAKYTEGFVHRKDKNSATYENDQHKQEIIKLWNDIAKVDLIMDT
jgi:hypothetical protein